VIKVAGIPTEQLLGLGWLGVLPFVTLSKGGKKPHNF
jgi:hypothetical protein